MTQTAAPSLAARQPRAIHSALTVLEAVAHLGPGATAREISTELGLPRATAYRLLNLLVQDEYLVRTPDLSGFALGAKVAQLAAVAAPPARLPTAAREVVAAARSALRAGVHVVLFADGRIVVADADPDFPLSDAVRLVREPERFALGMLLLVEGGAGGDATALYGTAGAAAADDLARYGATRRLGDGAGYGCIAVPIRDAGGVLVGAVSFCGPRHRVADPLGVLEVLQPAATALSPLVS
ncbi:helix-turn-helix domain-containing protein [Microbacterium fluvii]|uniref:Helix-turn-helix domain-containing protein n=1 Tax=Microbacterium fluvii TaxID=415215 RepID=A0ABW2HEA0_9MICO|nr:helix-turn-helix domain-containing protein [Microbacterium fluvii]MCU4671686.1 helix-turn-helix domain-containing protein [Microbacterium fluvii]